MLHTRAREQSGAATAPVDGRPFVVVGAGWLILMAGVNVATPLYAVYAQRYGFSSFELTTVFATYAAVLVPALVIFGRVSDRLGRRMVMLAGLAVGAVALLVFAGAQSAPWLYAGRALQGLSVGMISGAATAALVELEPRGDRRRAAMYAGLAQSGGCALGPLLGGVLAEWAPRPLRLPYLVFLAATILAGAMMLGAPDSPEFEPRAWKLQMPAVPPQIRAEFLRVSATAAVVWGALAMYLSVVPSYAADLLDTGNLALLAAIVAVAPGASALTQTLARRRATPARPAQAAGLCVLAVGLATLVAAAPLHSMTLLCTGSVLTGTGHGLAFLNAQEELNRIAPNDRRGEVTAAFITAIYAVVGTAVVAVGILGLRISFQHAVSVVALVLLAASLVITAWQLGGD